MDKKMYRWNAEDYKNSSGEQFKWAMELIEKLNLKGSEHLLDIGCGDGKITAYLAKYLNNGSVTGIDASKEMIDYAKNNFPENLYKNLQLRQLDVVNLDYNNDFDVVFSNAVLHWVQDHRRVLKGIYNSLKHGGKTLLQMGGKGNAALVFSELEVMLEEDKWKSYFKDFEFPWYFHTPEDYIPWLIAAGLRPIRVELIEKDMQHRGKEGIASWIRSTWVPYMQRIPDEKKMDFVDEISRRIELLHPQDSEGISHIRMFRLEVEAEKI